MEIYKKLLEIQNELKVSKNRFNEFGGFKYRSCEDILEALKPLCSKNGVVLIIKDEIVSMDFRGRYDDGKMKIEQEKRFYVKATVQLIDAETGDKVETSSFAREDNTKRGMDGCQITGSASSYARKYALNALFCIDDTKDSDYTNGLEASKGYGSTKKSKANKNENPKVEKLLKNARDKGFDVVQVKKVAFSKFNKTKLESLSDDEIMELEDRLNKVGGK